MIDLKSDFNFISIGIILKPHHIRILITAWSYISVFLAIILGGDLIAMESVLNSAKITNLDQLARHENTMIMIITKSYSYTILKRYNYDFESRIIDIPYPDRFNKNLIHQIIKNNMVFISSPIDISAMLLIHPNYNLYQTNIHSSDDFTHVSGFPIRKNLSKHIQDKTKSM